MPEPINLSLAFGLPPARAVEYFKSKGFQITQNWSDLWQDAHARAFTVSGVVKLDILQDIHDELKSAVKGKIVERDFIKKLEPTLRAKGWWGPQVQVDAQTMEARLAETGSPWRLKTIYRTNLQTAYMTGRYSQMMENVAFRPLWQYVAVMDERTRPAHAAMNGLVFRYDDPFWEHFYPPNGFNCRCTVRALSQRDIDSRGLTVRESGADLRERWKVEASTGLTERVADYKGPGMQHAGSTDLGWNYNPGRAWATYDPAAAAPESLPGEAAVAGSIRMVDGQKTWRDYGLQDLRTVAAEARLAAPDLLREGKTLEEAIAIASRALGLSDAQPLRIVETPIERVALRAELIEHPLETRKDARERYINFIVPTLTTPFEIWITKYGDGLRRRYIGLFQGRRDIVVIVRENNDGSLMWNFMQADDKRLNDFRIGMLAWKKGK